MPKDKRELLNSQTTYTDQYGWEKPLTVVDHSPKTTIGFGMTEEERLDNKENIRKSREDTLKYIINLPQEVLALVYRHYPHMMDVSANGYEWIAHMITYEEMFSDPDFHYSFYNHIKNIERRLEHGTN